MSRMRRAITGLLMLLGMQSPVIAQADPSAVWLDVRSVDEYNADHIEGSILLPHTNINRVSAAVLGEKDQPIYVYCRSGRRSAIAEKSLKALGFSNVTNIGGLVDAKRLRQAAPR